MDISTAADRLEQARSTNAGLPLFSDDPGGLSARRPGRSLPRSTAG